MGSVTADPSQLSGGVAPRATYLPDGFVDVAFHFFRIPTFSTLAELFDEEAELHVGREHLAKQLQAQLAQAQSARVTA